MKKALMVSTVIGFLAAFERNDIAILQSMGYEVHCATNNKYGNKVKYEKLEQLGVIKHYIPFNRSPISISNIKAFIELMKLIKKEKFDLVHCHTPVGGVVGRITAHRCHVPTIIYTAHGFHFYTGAPIKNWLLYFPIEWICSWWTDMLITINKEDYKRAKVHLHAKQTEYIPGVGINTEMFGGNYERGKVREVLGISQDKILLISVGELSTRKNHSVVIKALASLPENIVYVIVGSGPLKAELEKTASDLGVDHRVKLLGFRTDVPELLACSDLYVQPSLQEGLPVALMEAIASGLPVVASRIRGNTDLVEDGLFDPTNVEETKRAIEKTLDKGKQKEGLKSQFDIRSVNEEMRRIYKIAESKRKIKN